MTSNENKLLEVKNLTLGYKVYEGYLKVINNVSLDLYYGEKIGLIGESGCGKTTTMKAIMGILPSNAVIQEGEIFYKGVDLLKISKKEMDKIRKKNISMIFQDPALALNPVFKIREQFYDKIKYCSENKLTRTEVHNLSIKFLKDAALPEPDRILDSYPFQLSGGMKQRVIIGMSLVSANELLIADEPGTSLDVTIEDQIMRLLKSIVDQKGISILLISHALGTVRKFVDRVYVMYAGTIVEFGPTQEIFSNPKHPYTALLLSSVPRLGGKEVSKGIPGVVPNYLNPPKGCRFVTRCPYKMDICEYETPKMYEVGKDHYAACFHL